MVACVCARAYACVRAHVCVCVCVCVKTRALNTRTISSTRILSRGHSSCVHEVRHLTPVSIQRLTAFWKIWPSSSCSGKFKRYTAQCINEPINCHYHICYSVLNYPRVSVLHRCNFPQERIDFSMKVYVYFV